MSKLNWDKAKKAKPTNALSEEKERRKQDAAAKWLAHNEAKKAAPRQKRSMLPKRRQDLRQGPIDGRPGLIIYTDGACVPNPGRGGWGFVVYEEGKEIHSECGGSASSTNNIMEMTGVKMALLWVLDNGGSAVVISDSQYVVKGCNAWRFGWKAKGWRRVVNRRSKQMEPVKNAALWQEIDGLLRQSSVIVEWCKGHAGIRGNERADQLSNKGRLKAGETRASLAAIEQQLNYVV